MRGYFDFNATTPLFPEASEALNEALSTSWQNPSSLYHSAGAVKRRLEEVREFFFAGLGWEGARDGGPEGLVFTSGATEANNVVFAHLAASSAADASVIVSAVEHPAVLAPAERHFPGRVIRASVDGTGRVRVEEMESLIREHRPVLVSVMAANNETGVIQPCAEIAQTCREEGAQFHCDAAQAVGKVEVRGLADFDWVTASAHKFGGPKGIGFLLTPDGLTELKGAQTGGPQEGGFRAGTENFPAIAAMKAAFVAARKFSVSPRFRDEFESRMEDEIPGTRVICKSPDRLWNTSMLVMPSHPNLKWLTRLSSLGFQVSTGSACSAGKGNPSHVMEACGLDFDEMGRVIRISSGWQTTAEDWTALAGAFVEVGQSLSGRKSAKPDLSGLLGG